MSYALPNVGILYGQAYSWGHSVLQTHFYFRLEILIVFFFTKTYIVDTHVEIEKYCVDTTSYLKLWP